MRKLFYICAFAIVASVMAPAFALDVEVKFEAPPAASRAVDLMTVAPIASDTPMVGAQFVIAVRFDADFSMSVLNSSNVPQVLGDGKTVASFKNDQPDDAGYSVGRTSWTPAAAGQYHIHVVPADGSAAIDKAAFQVVAAPSSPAVKLPTVDNWTLGAIALSQPIPVTFDYTADAGLDVNISVDKAPSVKVAVTATGTGTGKGNFTVTPTFTTADRHTVEVTIGSMPVPASINILVPAATTPATVTTGVTNVVCPQYVIAGQPFNLTFDYVPATATPTATMVASDGSSMPMVAGSDSGGFGTFSGTFAISGAGKIVINVGSLPPFNINVTVLDVGTIVVPPMPNRIILSVGPGLAVSSGGRRTPFPGITAIRLGQNVVAPVPTKYQDYLSNDWIVGSERIGPRSTVIGFKWTREGKLEFAVGTR